MPRGERKRAEKCKHSELRGEGDHVFLGNQVRCLWGRQERAGRRRDRADSERTLIGSIRDLRWQDKSNQNAETRKKRQSSHVLLADSTHWSHYMV